MQYTAEALKVDIIKSWRYNVESKKVTLRKENMKCANKSWIFPNPHNKMMAILMEILKNEINGNYLLLHGWWYVISNGVVWGQFTQFF